MIAKYEKGDIVKTHDKLAVIMDTAEMEDVIIYKVEIIRTFGVALYAEDGIMYKVPINELDNERVYPDGVFIEEKIEK